MVIASTWTDPVLGVDTHIMLVPTPAGPVPTPLPLPFTGIVLDPLGMAINAAMGGSTILINGLPATNCGTNVMNLPPHLPVPGPPAKGKLDDDALLMFGALNVEIGGSLAVRLGDIALSCNDPVRLPVSVVLAVPKGPLVMVTPPMVPDLKLIATMLAFHAAGMILTAAAKLIGKGIRALQRGVLSKFFKGLSDRLKGLVKKESRFKQLWDDAICFLTGHPVDVATGRVLTSQTDLELFGPLPLTFSRRYDSAASSRATSLGYGWAHPFDQAIWPERGAIVLRGADGREIEFSTLHFEDRVIAPGREVFLPRERLTLRCHGTLHFSVTDAQGTVREFARVPGAPPREARLVRVSNRLGQQQTLSYTAHGHLESVRDPAGRTLLFGHDPAGRLIRLGIVGTDGASQLIAAYHYDAAGDLIQASDALGHSYRYEYVEHLLVKETNKNGLSFYFQYDGVDASAKCVRTWGDGGIYDHVITYDSQARRTLVENSLGHITLYQLNELGQVVSITDANGAETKLEYEHPSGQKTKETDPLGAETLSEYDERGNLIKTLAPDSGELSFEYSPENQLLRAVDAIGGEWQWAYDAHGRLIARENPLGERSQFHWSGPYLVAVTDALGQHTQLGYDAAGNLTSLTTPDASVTQWSYDGFGRTRSTINPNGAVQQRERDALGRVLSVAESDGNQRRLEYDREGNVIRAVDRHYDVRFEYRGMNRLAARIQNDTRVNFLYDSEDQLTAIQNEHGFVYRFVLGATGDVEEEWGFDDLRRRYARDAAGRVTFVLRPEGKTTTYSYDKAGRVISVEHSDGSKETYAYRADGAILEASNAAVSVQFERDVLGRITRELCGDDWVESQFDALGLRRAVRSSKGLFQKIQRNSMGDVLAIEASATHGGAFSANFQRDRLGLELERALPGGIKATWQRDNIGRPLRQEIWRGEQFHGAKQYTWDANDRLRRVIDAMTGPVEYTHDAFGNLAAAAYVDGRVDLRMPDAVGNLFRTQGRSDRKYGPAGQLLEARDARGVTTYEYDAEGNLIKKVEPGGETWIYEWNGAGMLVRVVRPNGRAVEFAYDALARRLSKTYRGKTTRWIWDGNVPLHEWVERAADAVDEDFSGTERAYDAVAAGEKALKALLAARPANGPPREAVKPLLSAVSSSEGTKDAPITWLFEPESFAPLAKIVGGERYGIVTDHLGTPTAMFDGAGREVWGADVDAYGDLRNLRGERGTCPFRWPGQYEDVETGLYYNRWRYYDNSIGSYLTQDPLRLNASHALYGYPLDPLTWLDPAGLAACGGTAAERLPPMKGMSVSEAEETLRSSGFRRTNPANPRNQRWVHADGSEAQIHAYGNAHTGPYKSGNNAHVHKDIGRHGEPGTIPLNDRGIPSTNPAETHIGIRNPSDFPTVAGRQHGS